MSRPTSQVAICNLALDYLKQAPISSISPAGTTTEVICARWYDMTRAEVLRKHPWNFAKKRVQLTATGTEPVFGYTYAFNLPNDYIRLCAIGDDAIEDFRTKYEMEDGQILINNDSNTLDVTYIYDCTSVVKFDALFVKVLALQLADNMATKFSVSAGIKEQIKDDLDRNAPWAMGVDGQERPPRRIQRSKFLQRRRGGSNRGTASPYTVFE